MPTLTRPSRIVDRHGKALSLHLYASPRTNLRSYRPRPWLASDTKFNVNEYDRAELVNYSRQIRAQVDVLATAIEQKNSWAFGDSWEPHYYGENTKWSDEAEEFLVNQFYPSCNVRGPQFDFRRSMILSGQAWDTDGDDALILTETENHFPQLAFFPSTRVGTFGGHRGATKNDTITDGPFKGLKIIDGTIRNRQNRIVGIRLINDDGTHSDISSFNADLAFEASWCDQVRGLPRIAVSLLRWMNLQDIDEFIQKGVKRAASVGLIIKNEEGEAGVGNEVITSEESPTEPDGDRELHFEEIAGGEAYYVSANGNEDIRALDFKNPHPNTEAFIERLQRGGLASVGWHYELLHLNDGGRAPSRLLCDLANMSIWDRQATGTKRWKRVITYALAKAVKHGFISKNPDPMDLARWEPGLPKQMSVDAGNDAQAAREAIKMGMSTKGIEAAKAGYHEAAIAKARLSEIKRSIADAKELFELVKSDGVSFQTCMEWVEQRSPNPVNQVQPTDDGNNKKDGKDK